MVWLEIASPVPSEIAATTPCAVSSDAPIVTSGSNIVTGLR